jgi:hypothetical protein
MRLTIDELLFIALPILLLAVIGAVAIIGLMLPSLLPLVQALRAI